MYVLTLNVLHTTTFDYPVINIKLNGNLSTIPKHKHKPLLLIVGYNKHLDVFEKCQDFNRIYCFHAILQKRDHKFG